MISQLTVDSFETEVLGSEIPVVVDFWSPGCGPCRLQDPILEELAAENSGRIQVKKINVWDEPDLATRFSISAVPTVLIFDRGEVVRTLVGVQDKPRLVRALEMTVQA